MGIKVTTGLKSGGLALSNHSRLMSAVKKNRRRSTETV